MKRDALKRIRGLGFSRGGRLAIEVIVDAVWLSGVIWLLFHYFFRRQGEFGDEPHPLEHWALVLHGAAAFASMFLAGALYARHVVPAWRSRRRPRSGLVVAAVFALLIVTGYLLDYAGGEALRAGVAKVHWIAGLPLPLALLVHRSERRRASVSRELQIAGGGEAPSPSRSGVNEEA